MIEAICRVYEKNRAEEADSKLDVQVAVEVESKLVEVRQISLKRKFGTTDFPALLYKLCGNIM